MSTPPPATTTPADRGVSSLVRAAIWVAIGALIAAALVSVVWVLIGSQNGIVGRAFLTILLLASFAGVAILDAHLAARRPGWFALTSMAAWVLTLLIGALLIWMPERPHNVDQWGAFVPSFTGPTRFASFLLIVLIIQLAVLHIRLYAKAVLRVPSVFNRVVGGVTVVLVVVLAVLLVLPLTVHEWVDFYDIYWRIVVAVSILAAVGTALVPLVNLLFGPRQPRIPAPVARAWPTFVDGVTPLPVLPDGSPDWQAYYTGYPTGWTPAQAPAGVSPTAQAAYSVPLGEAPAVTASEPPVQPSGFEGYPPRPPLPPR